MDNDDGEQPLFESRAEIRAPPANSNMARELIDTFKRHSNRTLLVDAISGREWTGEQLLAHCGKVATSLVRRAGVRANDVVMTICDRDDSEVVNALGIVMSGAALYPTMPTDGYNEAKTLCELSQPQVLVINSKYHERARKLCQNVAGMKDTKIVWTDGASLTAEQQQTGSASLANGLQRQTNGFSEKAPVFDDNNNIESIGEPGGAPIFALADSHELQHFDAELVESIANEHIDCTNHIFSLLLTSGSTGRPKVVPATHEQAVWGLYSMISAATIPIHCGRKLATDENNNNDNEFDTSDKDYIIQVSGADVVAGDLPLDHGAGLNVMILELWLGAKYIVMPSFDVELFWHSVHKYRITYSLASTSFCFKLFKWLKHRIEEGHTDDSLDLTCLKNISCCGAKLDFVELANEIRARYPQLTINQSYGCTEIGYIAHLLKRDSSSHIDSVGYLVPGVKAKIVDPSNLRKQLGPDERGELLVWSRSLFKGYRCHPEVDSEQVFRGCHDAEGLFYRTGDQAHFDSEGRLFIHGRFKDTLVLMGDWKIMPAELEAVVSEHPLVEISAVVGATDPETPGCHRPRAFVKLVSKDEAPALLEAARSGGDAVEHALLLARWQAGDLAFVANHVQEFVAARVAPLKRLTGGVRILDKFPTNGLLRKIDRKVLREMD